MSKFDDLFNDFLNDANNKKQNPDILGDLFKKILNLDDSTTKNMINSIDSKLGKPKEIENFEENGLFYQKQIWETKHGQIIKTIVSETPFKEKKVRIPLEKQLEKAVEEENYELAVKLRDRISKRETKKNKK